MRSRGQAALECANPYSETVTCNLHDMAQGRYGKANAAATPITPSLPTMPASTVFPSSVATSKEIKP